MIADKSKIYRARFKYQRTWYVLKMWFFEDHPGDEPGVPDLEWGVMIKNEEHPNKSHVYYGHHTGQSDILPDVDDVLKDAAAWFNQFMVAWMIESQLPPNDAQGGWSEVLG